MLTCGFPPKPLPPRRAQKVVIKTVDVSYGGENGFNQAIELAGETLGSVKLIQVGGLMKSRSGH